MSLYTAHRGFYEAVKLSILGQPIEVSVGDRHQAINGTEVIVQQLGGLDEYSDEGISQFTMVAYSFAKKYSTCAKAADEIYNYLFDLSQGSGITGISDIATSETHNYHINVGTRSMEYNDEDGFVASVICKITKY